MVERLNLEQRVSLTQQDASGDSRPWLLARLVAFMFIHLLTLAAELGIIGNFLVQRTFYLASMAAGPLALSGLLCIYAAWSAEPIHLSYSWGLPLHAQPLHMKVILGIALGLLQGVIILLACDQYLERLRAEKDKDRWNRYHCKAVASLCEGLPALTCVTYYVVFKRYNYHDSAHASAFRVEEAEAYFCGAVVVILLVSLGLGMVELDFCCSKTVSKRMQQSTSYELVHLLCRMGEVVSRTLIWVLWVVLMKPAVWWWWLPWLLGHFFLVFLLVLYHGGDESRPTVRILCCLPSTWANLFFFVDSPYKRRAARKVSFWLDMRFLVEVLLLPLIAFYSTWELYQLVGDENLSFWFLAHQTLDAFTEQLPWLLTTLLLSLSLFVMLRIYLQRTVVRQMNLVDLYTPSEKGDKASVKKVMDALVEEVRELTRSAAAEIDLDRPDVDGQTPLMLASRNGHVEVCELLVHRGALVSVTHKGDPGIRNWSSATWRSWTALHLAAWYNRGKVIHVLAPAACQEESQWLDLNGETPLHTAARAGAVEAAKALLCYWPSWLMTLDNRKRRPSDLAASAQLVPLLRPTDSWFTALPGALLSEGSATSLRPQNSNSHLSDSVNEVWLSVPLHISRTRVHLRAPGLCSYVAASCGGALGRLCLTTEDEEEDHEDLQLSDLVPIDRMGNQVNLPQAMIGEGAFGQVFRVRHRRREQLYALKVFKTPQDRPASPEVARECEVGTAVRQTPHPCIVHLYKVNFDEDSGLYTLLMEFCPSNLFQQVQSANLDSMAKSTAYRPPPQTLDWLAQVFLGLEHMHKRLNILFRDLKPSNVILDSALRAKLADFGSGKLGPSAGAYSFGHPAGTMGYCAPEVLGGLPHDESADLYSFGVLTWVLLTGGMPGLQPPVQPRPEVHQHLYDWLLLRKCLEDNMPPFQPVASSSPEDARLCVHLLVQPPEQRIRHSALREHGLFLPLQLPDYDAGPTQVESWLDGRGFAKRR